jgi:hypothetical protein
MMLAAADCVTGDTAPPPELQDYFTGELFGALPFSGGWKEQPMRWTSRVSRYYNIYSAFKQHADARRRLKGKDFMQWARQNKRVLDVVKWIEGLKRGEYD